MEDMKNFLTVTLVVMAAGSSIYTIKTFMKPGMDLNINLEENRPTPTFTVQQYSLAEALAALNQTLPVLEELSPTTDVPFGEVENNTIAELLLPDSKRYGFV